MITSHTRLKETVNTVTQEGSIWKQRVFHWRAAMEDFLIGMWRQCVPLLDQYDVVGAKQSLPPKAFYVPCIVVRPVMYSGSCLGEI